MCMHPSVRYSLCNINLEYTSAIVHAHVCIIHQINRNSVVHDMQYTEHCVCVCVCVCACICVTRLNFPHAGILQDRARFSTLFLCSHEMLFYPLLDKCRKCEEMSHFGKQNIQGISFLVKRVCKYVLACRVQWLPTIMQDEL